MAFTIHLKHMPCARIRLNPVIKKSHNLTSKKKIIVHLKKQAKKASKNKLTIEKNITGESHFLHRSFLSLIFQDVNKLIQGQFHMALMSSLISWHQHVFLYEEAFQVKQHL